MRRPMAILGKGAAGEGGGFVNIFRGGPEIGWLEFRAGRGVEGKTRFARGFNAALADDGETLEFHNAGRIIFLAQVHKRIIG